MYGAALDHVHPELGEAFRRHSDLEEQRVVGIELGHGDEHPDRTLDTGKLAHMIEVFGVDGAVEQIGDAFLADAEVRTTSSKHRQRGVAEARRQHPEGDDREDPDGDCTAGEDRARLAGQQVLPDQVDEVHWHHLDRLGRLRRRSAGWTMFAGRWPLTVAFTIR